MSAPTPAFSQIPAFRPYPLLRSGHAQTVFGAYEGRRPFGYRATQHIVSLDDGDCIVLHDDRPAAWSAGDPAVLLIHGLSGTHASAYVARPAQKLNGRGVRTFRMDLRGCGAGLKLAQGPTHAGRSHDAAAAVAKIVSLCPESPVFVIAFSMGANIALKMAGEMGAEAPASLRAVLAVAPPIDLAATCRHISSGVNKFYDRTFVRSLLRMVENRRQALPEARHVVLPRRPRRIWEFDELVTAPLAGFAGAEEYYARSSAAPLLPSIHVPTLIMTAADDPLVPIRQFETASYSPAVRLHVTEYGGHVGYFGAESPDADRRWLDWRLVEQIASLTKQGRESFSANAQTIGRQV